MLIKMLTKCSAFHNGKRLAEKHVTFAFKQNFIKPLGRNNLLSSFFFGKQNMAWTTVTTD